MAETKTSEIKVGDRRLTLEVTHDEVKALAGEDTLRTTRMSFRVRDGGGMVRQKGVVTHDRGIDFAKNDRTVKDPELRRALAEAGAPIEAPKAKPAPKPKAPKPAPTKTEASAKAEG